MRGASAVVTDAVSEFPNRLTRRKRFPRWVSSSAFSRVDATGPLTCRAANCTNARIAKVEAPVLLQAGHLADDASLSVTRPTKGRPMTERTLILLRHAKSDWSGDEPDIARPLAKRGRHQAPDAGRWLAANVARIDLAVVSPARRAQGTWELVAAELAAPPPIEVDERLYAASGPELLGVVRGLGDDLATVVVVGHNPGLEDVALLLTGERPPMPTSALALITVPGSWSGAGDRPAVLRASGRPPA
jgi:phosphohistidine phosphatase